MGVEKCVHVCVREPSTSVQESHYVCLLAYAPSCLCGFVYVCLESVIFVCILYFVKVYSSQSFTDFNEWTGVCVTWDLMLLTDGVKGRMLTFTFHPACRWTANQLFIFAAIVELVY